MLQYDFDQSVGCWIALTAHAMRRELASQLAAEGITLRQWEVLAWVALEEKLTQGELAERLGIEAATLVGILDRMERDGWLARRAHSTIRAHRVRSQATDGFSENELTTFKAMCQRIRDNLSAGAREPRMEHGANTDGNGAAKKRERGARKMGNGRFCIADR